MNNKANGNIFLYIEPYVHIKIKGSNILLYNTLNGEKLVYKNSPAITGLVGRMTSKQHLNAIIEETTILEEKNLHEFLETGKNMELINWYNYSKKDSSHKKPVSLPSILNFHRGREKMDLDPERNPGQDIMQYLHKLNIYINCYHGHIYKAPVFRDGYKQFLFPYSAKEYTELKLPGIQQLLDQVKELERCNIIVLGGNIFAYKELDGLVKFLAQLPLKKELGVFYKDITIENLERVDWEKSKDIPLKIFVTPQMDKDQLINCIELLKEFNISSTYQFTVQSEANANELDEVIDLLNQSQFSVKPFYNGSNLNFFKENIFIEEADLSDPVVSKKDIYARWVMNPGAFGHITILSNGDVHSNVNEKPIGTIDHDVKQLLLKELSAGRGWFRLRKDLAPCQNCIYQQICPPVSNYEYALSRNNLCRIHQETLEK
ncbi:MAG: TIGR04150 pseudo-rSAM protein [Candidatus Aminicenantes bacterium]|nr:MAG: TIGR04150 pseudo-rSAM protein [Candidatus Aminicenantes bacterium]